MAKDKKTTPEETKDLTTTQGTKALEVYDYGEDAVPIGQVGVGYENQTGQDASIPFMTLLQPITPLVVEGKLPGAQAGMWLNTLNQKLYPNPQGFNFVPSTTRHEFTQFRPRKHGGGYVGRFAIDSEVVAAAKARSKNFGEYYIDAEGRTGEDGDELTETFYVFGVVCDGPDPVGPALIAFKSTMIRCYKNWMSQIRQHTVDTPHGKRTPPLFAHLAKFTSEGKKNNEGFFFVPVYTPGVEGSVARSCLSPDDPRFLAAKSVKTMVDAGAAKVNYERQAASTDGEVDGVPTGPNGKPLF